MNRWQPYLLAALLLTAIAVDAHEGHDDEPAATDDAAKQSSASARATPRPHLLPDGQLYVPKAVQHALGLRTEVFAARTPAQMQMTAEVIADPNAAGALNAAQTGRLEAASQGWPLPGERVHAGETLAYLHPLLSLNEQAQRRAALAQLDNDLQISEINVARLKLQADANATAQNSGNVYYEQARLDYEALQKKYQLESEALNSRVTIQAPVDGVLSRISAQAGEIIAQGQPVFEVVDPTHLRIALQTFDPGLAARLQTVQLKADEINNSTGAADLALKLRAQEPLSGRQGWRLLFDAQTPAATSLMPGQLVTLSLRLAAPDAQQILASACVAGADGHASAWVHQAPERFERRSLPGCQSALQDEGAKLAIADGERVVTQGAALLSEYR